MIINTFLMLPLLTAQQRRHISPHYFPVQETDYHIFTSTLWIDRKVSTPVIFASQLFFLSVIVTCLLNEGEDVWL